MEMAKTVLIIKAPYRAIGYRAIGVVSLTHWPPLLPIRTTGQAGVSALDIDPNSTAHPSGSPGCDTSVSIPGGSASTYLRGLFL